jgi:hypothetical protein
MRFGYGFIRVVAGEFHTGETLGWRNPAFDRWHKPALGLVGAAVAVSSVAGFLRLPRSLVLPGIDALVWWFAAASALIGLARRLPFQNVVAVAGISAGVSWLILWIGAMTDIPFGRRGFSPFFGFQLPGGVPWGLVCVWVTLTPTCRGIARLMLRSLRRNPFYGLWVMALATGFTLLWAVAIESVAQSRQWWRWESQPGTVVWAGAPWVTFLGWGLTSLILYGFTTPWLLNKQPIRQPTDWHPLVLNLLLLLQLAGTAVGEGSVGVAVCLVVGGLVLALVSVRGARRTVPEPLSTGVTSSQSGSDPDVLNPD